MDWSTIRYLVYPLPYAQSFRWAFFISWSANLTIILNECINDRETLCFVSLGQPLKKKRRAKQQMIKQGENLMTTFVGSFTLGTTSTFNYSLYLQELGFGFTRRQWITGFLSERSVHAKKRWHFHRTMCDTKSTKSCIAGRNGFFIWSFDGNNPQT